MHKLLSESLGAVKVTYVEQLPDIVIVVFSAHRFKPVRHGHGYGYIYDKIRTC